MTWGSTLTNTFAHELGHTFGLGDCYKRPSCGTELPNNNVVVSYSVMDSNEPAPPDSNGWDDSAKNFTEGTAGPLNADLQVIDAHLPDYAQCIQENAPPPAVAQCTNGTAVGFLDTGQNSSYTCGGSPCTGCNAACNNFAPQPCPDSGGGGSGGSGGGGSPPACAKWCGDICMDGAVCSNGLEPYCDETSGGWVPACPSCPVIIDAFGEGFHLTGLTEGVHFRVLPEQSASRMSWTDQQWRNGWLALDRNGNGRIDDFTELFGDFTPQPHAANPNGYAALAIFDDRMNGGNGNGIIDPADSVYDHLLLWIDSNHNGFSEPGELHSLRDVGIFQISLKYIPAHFVDANGNQFRYKARILDDAGAGHDVCYDVFLSVEAKIVGGATKK